jgi:hypothetical protein
MAARAFVFEEHAGVLPHWAGRGLRDATLVCFDAHLDLQFIGAPRIARLQACGGPQELRLLASAHPLSPRRDACYGIEDFLYAAARLGLVRRLVWVAPPHVLAAAGAAWRALQQMEGVTPQELASLRRVPGGWIEGRLLGVPIAILRWEQLRAFPLEGPLALDIDADYFVQVPGDRPRARAAHDRRPAEGAGRRNTGTHDRALGGQRFPAAATPLARGPPRRRLGGPRRGGPLLGPAVRGRDRQRAARPTAAGAGR